MPDFADVLSSVLSVLMPPVTCYVNMIVFILFIDVCKTHYFCWCISTFFIFHFSVRHLAISSLYWYLYSNLSFVLSERVEGNCKHCLSFPSVCQYHQLLASSSRLQRMRIDLLHTVFAFSALTLLAGLQEEHLACKNWVMRCWCGCLSGARCKLFAYGLADATASQNPIISCLI